MKPYFLLSLGLWVCACSNTTTQEPTASPASPTTETTAKEAPKPEPALLSSAKYEQLVGIWKLVEERSHPAEKGEKPFSTRSEVLFGFDKGGKFVTSSLGMDYVEGAMGVLGTAVVVKDGIIQPGQPDEMFTDQWGDGLKVYALSEDELIMQYSTMKNEPRKRYSVFKRMK